MSLIIRRSQKFGDKLFYIRHNRYTVHTFIYLWHLFLKVSVNTEYNQIMLAHSYLFIYPSIYISISLYVHIINLSIYSYIFLCQGYKSIYRYIIYLSIYISIPVYIYLSLYISILYAYLCLYLYNYLCNYFSIYLFLNLSFCVST